MKEIKFYKYEGDGNDFIILEDLLSNFSNDIFSFVRKICDRRFGIGADGAVFFEKSKKADIKIRIFNSDGSEALCCGNALLSSLHHFYINFSPDSKINNKAKVSIETMASIIHGKKIGSNIYEIDMPDAKILKDNATVSIFDKAFDYFYIDSGVTHITCFLDDHIDLHLAKFDVNKYGKALRYLEEFAPLYGNVNFIEKNKKLSNSINVRTYEKGVEAETFSCGTGSVASAIAASSFYKLSSPIDVQFKTGKKTVSFVKNKDSVTNIKLTSCVNFVYCGFYYI